TPSSYNPDYIPAVPVKIDVPASNAGLAPCWNSNPLISPLTSTAYDFTFQTSPRDSNLPGIGYTLIFDVTNVTYQDKSKLKCATCNADLGEWEILESSYGKYQTINNHYGVSCNATHFTPYMVVEDNRIAPLAKPSNFRMQCSDGNVTLYWEAINDENNTGYRVYQCSTTQCSTVKQTLTGSSATSVTYNIPNGTQVCYAVQGISSNTNQDADVSEIKCSTPSSDPLICKIEDITLVSPGNNSSINDAEPKFIFIGSGKEDYYIVNIEDTQTKSIMLSTKVDGEGSSTTTTGTRKTFEVNYTGTELLNDRQYKWSVDGYRNIQGKSLSSGSWYFTYVGGQTGEDCCAMETTPSTVVPNNGISLQGASPILSWKSVKCAKNYIISVRNESGNQVYQVIQPASNQTQLVYGGTSLVDNVTYYWDVIAENGCGSYSYGNTAQFTKIAQGVNAELPIPRWVEGQGMAPIIGGNQLVSLRWYEETDPIVKGYAIYRGTDPTSLSLLDIVYKNQLGGPLPNSNCPVQFSESNPGYCDISVSNGERYYYKLACVQTGGVEGERKSVAQSVQLALQRPDLISPGSVTATDVTAEEPIFMWFPVNGIGLSYIITLVDNTSGAVVWQKNVTAAGSGSTESLDYDGPTLELGKTYRWSVRALNSKVQSEESQIFRFTKRQAAGKPATPNWCGNPYCSPQQADAYAADDAITIFWEKASSESITKYNLYRCMDEPGICTERVAVVSNAICETKTKVVCFVDTGRDRGHDYYYNIEAVDSGGTASDPSVTLQVPLKLKGPTAVYPVYDQTVYTPTPEFSWIGERGATKYHVQVAKKSDGFTNPLKIIWTYVVDGTGEGTFSAVYDVDKSAKEPLLNPSNPDTPGTSYVWRVCSENANYPTLCSGKSSTMQFSKNFKPPETVGPKSGERLVNSEVTFKWSKTPGAAGYTLRVCKRQGAGSNCNVLPIVYQKDVVGADVVQDTMTDVTLES
ncbi:MAG TPA: hypothetical protein PLQ76_04390, partial [bacterium]|nr:hypothetical protein [bacterium]